MPVAAAALRAPTRVDRERQPWGSLAVLSLNLFVLRLFLMVPIVWRPRWARSSQPPRALLPFPGPAPHLCLDPIIGGSLSWNRLEAASQVSCSFSLWDSE